jgi:hypothetical protein
MALGLKQGEDRGGSHHVLALKQGGDRGGSYHGARGARDHTETAGGGETSSSWLLVDEELIWWWRHAGKAQNDITGVSRSA